MQRWEYKVNSLAENSADDQYEQTLTRYLNSLGQQGWELVGVLHVITTDTKGNTHTSGYQLIFKRSVPQP